MADADDTTQFKADIAASEPTQDQINAYLMALREERLKREAERRRRETEESLQKALEESLWRRFREEFESYISPETTRNNGMTSTYQFFDELDDFRYVRECKESQIQEELDDLEVGETGCLDEFLSSFQ